MPIPQKIIKFLEKAGAKYEPIKHRTVYTAFDKAATLRVLEKIVGKTLVLKINGKISLVLIPANKNLDKEKFKKVINIWLKKQKIVNSHGRIRIISRAKRETLRYSHAEFASERLIKNKLKGVKVGAIPPFGNLWDLPTFVDRGLLKNPKIIVNAGDYNWSIKINSAGLKKLIPDLVIGSFGKAK